MLLPLFYAWRDAFGPLRTAAGRQQHSMPGGFAHKSVDSAKTRWQTFRPVQTLQRSVSPNSPVSPPAQRSLHADSFRQSYRRNPAAFASGASRPGLHAQNNGQNQDSARSFVQSVAKTVYNLAWPTATYKSVALDRISPDADGVDIVITLSGLSAFDESDLWVKLALLICHGEFSDIRVIDDNHILVAPFATTNALAQAVKQTVDDYAAQQQVPATPMPAPAAPASSVEAVCLSNQTGTAISFQYRWGDGAWTAMQATTDRDLELWWNLSAGEQDSPALSIRYDDDFADGYTERSYVLPRTKTVVPILCDKLANYHFAMVGSKIEVYLDSH